MANLQLPLQTRLNLGILTILCLTTTYASAQTAEPAAEEPAVKHNAGEDMYGLGVRLGIYFQALAFLIGFANVLRLDPKSQFSGVVIAFAILVRWFTRLHDKSISTAELWVGLALLLLVSAPGMWLLFFTLEVQRNKWYKKIKDRRLAFAEVTKGQTLNILQALVVFLWTVVANSWFSYWIVGRNLGDEYPPQEGQRNVIWLGTTTSVKSNWVKIVLITQAALGTAFTAVPAFIYVLAAAFAVIAYWFPRGGTNTPLLGTDDELDKQTRLETKRWAYGFGAVLFCVSLCLLLSVELTIKHAGLTPTRDVESPGQLLPLIAGSLSCASAAADAFGRHIPKFEERRAAPSIAPFRDERRDGGDLDYVPLNDLQGHEYRRDSAAASLLHNQHSRVGSETIGAETPIGVRSESLASNRQSGYGFPYENQPAANGRNSAYEPFTHRALPR
jgi:hypothetical protein